MNTIDVEISLRPKGRLRPTDETSATRPRIPRITRLMALAIKFQDMIDRQVVRDYADLARLGYVSRARLTQIMNLLLLAPDIQAHLLELAPSSEISETVLRKVCDQVHWPDQRVQFIG